MHLHRFVELQVPTIEYETYLVKLIDHGGIGGVPHFTSSRLVFIESIVFPQVDLLF